MSMSYKKSLKQMNDILSELYYYWEIIYNFSNFIAKVKDS